jgi:hypothetical protein
MEGLRSLHKRFAAGIEESKTTFDGTSGFLPTAVSDRPTRQPLEEPLGRLKHGGKNEGRLLHPFFIRKVLGVLREKL